MSDAYPATCLTRSTPPRYRPVVFDPRRGAVYFAGVVYENPEDALAAAARAAQYGGYINWLFHRMEGEQT